MIRGWTLGKFQTVGKDVASKTTRDVWVQVHDDQME